MLVAETVVPESRKTPFYPALDGLRAIAVGLVFLVHFLPAWFPLGWVGVQIFFVLSGFLITGILFDTHSDRHRFRNFYARRSLRIFPLYYGVLGALGIVVLITRGAFPPNGWMWAVYVENFWWLTVPATASDAVIAGATHHIAAIGHLWSLAIEEQFYLLWPLVVFWIKDRRRLMQVCLAGIILRLLLAAYWQFTLSPHVLATGVIYRMLPTQCDAFLLGGWLALWLRGKPSARVRGNAGRLALIAIVAYAICIVLVRFHAGAVAAYDYRSIFQALVGIPLVNGVSLLLILAVIQQRSWVAAICNLPVARSLGRVSYGLYVYHLPVFVLTVGRVDRLCKRLHISYGTAWLEFFVASVTTIAISYLSFYLFEARFLLLKNRFTSIEGAKEKAAARHPIH